MTKADEYRAKAAELNARARLEMNPTLRSACERLAQSYTRLSEQADRNSQTDIVYETPPQRKSAQPAQQQQPQLDNE